MIKHLQKVAALALVGFAFVSATDANAQKLVENFNYSAGTLATANGWTEHSSGSSTAGEVVNPIAVVESGLSYNAYKASEVSNAVALTTSGQDISKVFDATGVSSGTVYAGVLVNASAASTGEYFFHLGPSTLGFTFGGRVFIKAGENGGVKFSVSKGSTVPTVDNYSANEYALNTTHLVVLKYTFVDGDTNDEVKIFVNPDLSNGEPTSATVTASDLSASDYDNLGTVALRQGSSSKSATLIADGIVVGTTWQNLVATTTGIADATRGMFSVYPNPVQNQNVKLALPGHVADQKVSLTVHSVEGKVLFQSTGSQLNVQQSLNEKVASLPKGMFFVNLAAGKEIYQTKLLKN